jgi:glycosyltransferase involved in cell wall biosynthesis
VYPNARAEHRVATCEGVDIISFTTVRRSGFDTLLHSVKVTYDIIRNNRADIIHIQNGGNSIFGAILRLFGKKTYLSQDGIDWERKKWPWYAKVFLFLSSFLTAHVHSAVIFDNVFAREVYTRRFKKSYDFIPFGADVTYQNWDDNPPSVLERLGLEVGGYFLFVGRFIPDKGLHWLVPAFESVTTDKKLVLIGGSPNGSAYEQGVRSTADPRILMPGFLYGDDVHALMCNAYAYVQPSAIEGLSPVILESAFLGAPIICTDIPQNRYVMGEFATYFKSGDVSDLAAKLIEALLDPAALKARAIAGGDHVTETFSWNAVVDQHEALFRR